jgi:ribonuclease BN (tRNA processing enzyme)
LLDDHGKRVFKIGYTGDTAFFKELSSHLNGCEMLVVHMSQPDAEELRDPSKRKDAHLGYRGVIDLIRETSAKLVIVGEFWAGIADVRIDLVNAVRSHCKGTTVLPAAIGMHIRLPGMEIECSACQKPTPYTEVRVTPSARPFGDLLYLCRKCILE